MSECQRENCVFRNRQGCDRWVAWRDHSLCLLASHTGFHVRSDICIHTNPGMQVGSMDEESQVRGSYNITFIFTPTRKQCLC